MLKIAKDLFDVLYPVGTYYETSNANWTPSSAGWYGTWQEDTAGKTTVAKSTDIEFNSIGKTGGEKTHTLTINEIPRHSHAGWWRKVNASGNTYVAGLSDAYDGVAGASVASDTGGSQPHNNLQPYIVVRRWHRTA